MATEKNMIAKKRKCHGYPGHECNKEIYDYRCPECWAKYRLILAQSGRLNDSVPGDSCGRRVMSGCDRE